MCPRHTSLMQALSATQLQPGYQMSLHHISDREREGERERERGVQEKGVISNSLVDTQARPFIRS